MSMQQIMRWGNDFLRIGGYSNLWANGEKPNFKGRTHQNCQLPFLSYSPNHLLLPEIGWVGYCMGWARYENPNSNWISHQFLENMFWLLGQVKSQKGSASWELHVNKGWMIKNVSSLPKMWGKMKTWMHEGMGILFWVFYFDTWIFPNGSRLNFPPLSLEIMPPSHYLLQWHSWLWVFN